MTNLRDVDFPLAALAKMGHGGKCRGPSLRILLDLMAIFSRTTLAVVLFAALVWIVMPITVIAATQANHVEGEACPCCDGPATVGPIMACPGCQAATAADGDLPLRLLTISFAWTEASGTRETGIDPGPDEPPPR